MDSEAGALSNIVCEQDSVAATSVDDQDVSLVARNMARDRVRITFPTGAEIGAHANPDLLCSEVITGVRRHTRDEHNHLGHTDSEDLSSVVAEDHIPSPIFKVRNAAGDCFTVEIPKELFANEEQTDGRSVGDMLKKLCVDEFNADRAKMPLRTGTSTQARGENLLTQLPLPPSMVDLVMAAESDDAFYEPLGFEVWPDSTCEIVELDRECMNQMLHESRGQRTCNVCTNDLILVVRGPDDFDEDGDLLLERKDEDRISELWKEHLEPIWKVIRGPLGSGRSLQRLVGNKCALEDLVLSTFHRLQEPEAVSSNSKSRCIAEVCAGLNFLGVVKLLHGAGVDLAGSDAVYFAARNPDDDTAICDFLVEIGADIRGRAGADTVPLIGAVLSSNQRLVKTALDLGADPNAALSGGRRALSYATDPAVARLLLGGGALVDGKDGVGRTALHTLCLDVGTAEEPQDIIETVRVLLAAGSDPDARTDYGNPTPLHVICDCNCVINEEAAVHVVQLLLDHGATVTALDEDGCTALHYAARRLEASAALLGLLLQQHAFVDARSTSGETPLFQAVQKSDGYALPGSPALEESSAVLLVQHGADPSLVCSSGNTPLDLCRQNGWSRLQEALEAAAARYKGGCDKE